MKNILVMPMVLSLLGCVVLVKNEAPTVLIYDQDSSVLKTCDKLSNLSITKDYFHASSDKGLSEAKYKIKHEASIKFNADALTITKIDHSVGTVYIEGVAFLCSKEIKDRKFVKENKNHTNENVDISVIKHSSKKPNFLSFSVKSVSETRLTPLRTHEYKYNKNTGESLIYISAFSVTDNFNNSLEISEITPQYNGEKLRPNENIIFSVLLKDSPIELTDKLFLSIDNGKIGNFKDIILEYSLR
jgi:hypothetical protein